MTTASTTLLGLALPVTGELSGTWGDVVNASLTNLLDTAIAGTTTLSSDADVTLSTTTLSANQARQAVILWTAGGTATRTITAPAQSKSYVVINATSSSQSIKLVGVGPTTGITIVAGEKCFAAWNGSDFVKVGNTSGAGVFSTVTASSLTSGRVTYAGTAGLLQDSANLLYSGTDLTVYGLTVGRGGGAVSTNTAVGASALAANTSGDRSVAVGYQAATANTTGINTVVGYQALKTNTTGTENTAVGFLNLQANTTGGFNTSFGDQTLYANTTGSNNVGVGFQALQANTTASYSTAVGYQTAYSNVTGAKITAVGFQALYTNTASHNTAIGSQSLYSNLTGQYNIAVGCEDSAGFPTLYGNTTGSSNVAMGAGALKSNTTASYNTAVGYQAGYTNVTGTGNTYIGYIAGKGRTGNYNTAVGMNSLTATGAGAQNTAIGYDSMQGTTSGVSNTGVGFQPLYQNITGNYNTAVGDTALFNTTAGYNTAVGYQSLYANTTAIANTAVGYQAASANTTGGSTTAVGYQALRANTTGDQNVAMGESALYATTTGSYNTAMGTAALKFNTTASNNTAVGYQAGYTNTTGIFTAIGYQAGYSNTTGNYNTFVGNLAGNANTTSSENTAVGYQAGRVSTGADNTYLGTYAGYSATTGTYNCYVGTGAGFSMTTGAKNTILGSYNGNQGSLDIRTASNYIVLSDGDGNPRGIFDSSGNLGLGVTPSAWASTFKVLQFKNGVYYGQYDGGGIPAGYFGTNNYYNGSTYIYVTTAEATRYQQVAGEHQFFTAPSGTLNTAVSWTQAMTLSASGNLGVGNSSGVGRIESYINSATIPAIYARQDGVANIQTWLVAGGTVRAYILPNGGFGNFSANDVNLSDERTKTEISLANNYLEKICAIPVKTFKYKDQTDDTFNLGVIAQDVEAVAPELVSNDGFGETPEDGIPLKAIYQTDLQYALMKCIQEQQAIITALTTRITALENK